MWVIGLLFIMYDVQCMFTCRAFFSNSRKFEKQLESREKSDTRESDNRKCETENRNLKTKIETKKMKI